MKNLLLTIVFIAISLVSNAQINRPGLDTYNMKRAFELLQEEKLEEAISSFEKEINENPKNGYAYAWQALSYCRNGEYGKALTSINKSFKFLPQKDKEYIAFAYLEKGQIYELLEDTLQAINEYSSAIKTTPNETKGYEQRANLYFYQGKYDLAETDYKKIIELEPGNTLGYMGVGRNYKTLERWDEAINAFSYAIKLDETYSNAYAFRAEAYIGKKDYDKATDDLIKALGMDGNDKAFYLMQDLEGEGFNKLKAKFQIQANKTPNNAFWPYYLGIIHEHNNMYDKAIKYYLESNTRNANATVLERIARCYNSMGKYTEAMKYIDQALNMSPDDDDLLSLKANTTYDIGNTEAAIAVWDSVIALRPDFYWAYYRRGWFKKLINKDDEALEDFDIAVTLAPKYVYSYDARGRIYLKQGKKEQAEAEFRKIIEIEQESGDIDDSPFAYLFLGDYDKCIALNDSILLSDTTNAGNYYNAACLYSLMNKTEEALKYFEKTLQMGHLRFAHFKLDSDLDNIRNLDKYKELIEKYQQEDAEQENSVMPTSQNSKVIEIPFTKDNGNDICKVKCSINKLPLYFIFDTGASSVSISQVEATFMLKNGYLDKKDIVGTTRFMDATGNVNVGTIINIRQVELGGYELTNIRASVVANQNAPLLLGQSVLGRLGSIQIDNAKQVLKITTK